MKKLALTLSAAAAVMWSASAEAQQEIDIQVVAASAFGVPANDFGEAFGSWYNLKQNLNYNVGLAIEDDASIESDIINHNIFVDLYFSATSEIPERLARHHPKLVVGRPFPVAIDSLVLYSTSVDISTGLPFPLTTKFAIPDPTQDNYGVAAAQILAQRPWRIPASLIPPPFTSLPASFVLTYPSVGVTFAAVRHAGIPYGFVARSEVCSLDTITIPNGTPSYPAGSFHHEYRAFGQHPYNPELVTVTAIRIANNRTADQEVALANYVAFLTGARDSFGDTNILQDGFTFGQDRIRAYCLKIPRPFGWEAANLDR